MSNQPDFPYEEYSCQNCGTNNFNLSNCVVKVSKLILFDGVFEGRLSRITHCLYGPSSFLTLISASASLQFSRGSPTITISCSILSLSLSHFLGFQKWWYCCSSNYSLDLLATFVHLDMQTNWVTRLNSTCLIIKSNLRSIKGWRGERE